MLQRRAVAHSTKVPRSAAPDLPIAPAVGVSPTSAGRRVIRQRMLRVLKLDRSVYAEIERDPAGTRQAAIVVGFVATAAAVGTVLAEPLTTPEVIARPKMATDIPASITTPNVVKTRLGTLNFFDGLPDAATVKTVYDNLDFQRGVQAFLTAIPAASAYAMTTASRCPRARSHSPMIASDSPPL